MKVRERKTEKKAREIVENFRNTNNISNFLNDVSYWSSCYSRFQSNRELFINEVIRLFQEQDILL